MNLGSKNPEWYLLWLTWVRSNNPMNWQIGGHTDMKVEIVQVSITLAHACRLCVFKFINFQHTIIHGKKFCKSNDEIRDCDSVKNWMRGKNLSCKSNLHEASRKYLQFLYFSIITHHKMQQTKKVNEDIRPYSYHHFPEKIQECPMSIQSFGK